jgi:hypothetical protein
MTSLTNPFKAFSWRVAVVAVIVAIPLVVSTLWVRQQLSAVPVGYREGSTFQLIEGEGTKLPAGLQVRGVGAQGRAIVTTELPDLAAEQYESVRFDIEGLDAAEGAGIYFTVKSQPTVGHPRALTLQMARQGVVRISEDPRWEGQVQTIGFIVQGPLKQPIVFRGLTLVPTVVSPVGPAIWIGLGILYSVIAYAGLMIVFGGSLSPQSVPSKELDDAGPN